MPTTTSDRPCRPAVVRHTQRPATTMEPDRRTAHAGDAANDGRPTISPCSQRANTPEMTRFLGGPENDEALAQRHADYLALWESGEVRMFRVRSTERPRATPGGGRRSTTARRSTRSAASSSPAGRDAASPRPPWARSCAWRPPPATGDLIVGYANVGQRGIQRAVRASRVHARRHRRVPGRRRRGADDGEHLGDRHVSGSARSSTVTLERWDARAISACSNARTRPR